MSAADWDDILGDGEEILWQGRPEPGWDWSDLTLFEIFVAATSPIIATVMLIIVWRYVGQMPEPRPDKVAIFFTVFVLFQVCLTLHRTFGRVILENLGRRHTFYTLTNRAAFIGHEQGGQQSLNRLALHQVHKITWNGDDPGSILFVKERTRRKRYRLRPIGFRMIPETPLVFSLLKTINPKAAT